MKATKFQSVMIVLKVALATLWISILVIYRTYRGIYTREHCDRILRWWAHKCLEHAKLTYSVHNPHGVHFEENRPYIIMSNHSSLFDIPFTFLALPGSIRMLAKKELFRVPLWGKGMQAGEFLSIDRENSRQAFRDLEEARKRMESGIILWVAPEGTRSRTGKLGPFKKGGFMLAAQTKAIIIPVGIRGAFEVLPPKTFDFLLGSHLEFHIGRPIDVSRYHRKRIGEVMEQVEQQIKELADVESEAASQA